MFFNFSPTEVSTDESKPAFRGNKYAAKPEQHSLDICVGNWDKTKPDSGLYGVYRIMESTGNGDS